LRDAVFALFVATLLAVPLHAADTSEPIVLSPAARAAIGRAFAPVLVFHPLEDYLPTSPMFPYDSDDLPEFHREGGPGVRALLGSQDGRATRYRALSAGDKIAHAAVEYRVFSRRVSGRVEVVAEYWCYYVFNAFTVRGGWLPYRVPDNHPNDLERFYIVLIPAPGMGLSGANDAADEAWARATFRIARVIANAHDGSIPPNQYDTRPGEVLSPPLTVLVERGSHAMAPDINHDGAFTSSADSTATTKLLWGIRDRGTTWGRYRSSFMDGRGESAVRLCSASTAAEPAEACEPYALYPINDLQEWFRSVHFSRSDLQHIVGRTPLIIRAFGDVRVEHLMIPSDPADGRVLDKMLHRRAKTEAGYVVGFTATGAHVPTLVAGRRYFWDVQSRYLPDVMAEAVALFPVGGRRMADASIFGSYSLDAITNVLVGVGWVSDADEAADVLVGLDLRIGRLRVRPTWRVRGGVFDSRVTTTF
jgi:hypothetical protein